MSSTVEYAFSAATAALSASGASAARARRRLRGDGGYPLMLFAPGHPAESFVRRVDHGDAGFPRFGENSHGRSFDLRRVDLVHGRAGPDQLRHGVPADDQILRLFPRPRRDAGFSEFLRTGPGACTVSSGGRAVGGKARRFFLSVLVHAVLSVFLRGQNSPLYLFIYCIIPHIFRFVQRFFSINKKRRGNRVSFLMLRCPV